VSRAWKPLVALLGVQAGLAAAAFFLERWGACGACRTGGASWAAAGIAAYLGLLGAALLWGPTRFLFGGILAAFGVHAALAVQLLTTGLHCWICFGATAISIVLMLLSIACDRANLGRLAFLLPWSVLLVVGWSSLPWSVALAGTPTTDGATVRMTIFTQPDCSYCDELRERVVPEIEREFGPRVQTVYRPAGDLPALRQTPTIIISLGRRDRVIEGLPSLAALREAIRTVEGKR
jgi:hypothetical protein